MLFVFLFAVVFAFALNKDNKTFEIVLAIILLCYLYIIASDCLDRALTFIVKRVLSYTSYRTHTQTH